MRIINAQIAANTEAPAQKELELQRIKDSIGRYKKVWKEEKNWKMQIDGNEDISLEDLERSEQMLKKSLFAVGLLTGLSNEQLEIEWQRIKLEAESRDVH